MGVLSSLPSELEVLATIVIDCAFKVHRTLGPGLLESVYQSCLCIELDKRGIAFEVQAALPITYEGVRLEGKLRLDLLVEKSLIVEIKSVEKLLPVTKVRC
jgi:GxxExxY protein